MSLAKSLKAVLAKANKEGPVCAWLKKHPLVIAHGLGGFPGKVVAEFPFGSDFRADFVMLSPFSGGWDVHFAELEPPEAALFTRHGVAAKRLNDALAQVNAWRFFVETERHTVLRDLSKFAKKKELVCGARDHEPVDHCGWPLYHPSSCINWEYHIVIGRRKLLAEVEMAKKAAYLNHSQIDVMTYDRLIEAAAKLDAAETS